MYETKAPPIVGEFDNEAAAEYAQRFLGKISLEERQNGYETRKPGNSGRYDLTNEEAIQIDDEISLIYNKEDYKGRFKYKIHTPRSINRLHESSKWHQHSSYYGVPARLLSGFSSIPTEGLVGKIDFSKIVDLLLADPKLKHPPTLRYALSMYQNLVSDIIENAIRVGDAYICGGTGSDLTLHSGNIYDITGLIHRVPQASEVTHLDVPRMFLFHYTEPQPTFIVQ